VYIRESSVFWGVTVGDYGAFFAQGLSQQPDGFMQVC